MAKFDKSKLTGLNRLAVATVAVTFLSACLGEGTAPQALSVAAPTGSKGRSYALAQASIVPERVVAKGPKGFCIDMRSLKALGTGGFALLAPCAALGGKATGHEEPVLMTIQAHLKGLKKAPATAAGMAEAFTEYSPIFQETGDGVSLLQLARGGDDVIPRGEPKHWRAALSFNGYLIGLALYSEKGGAASGARGKALLLEFAEAVLDASPLETSDPAAPAEKKTKRHNLLRGLLQ